MTLQTPKKDIHQVICQNINLVSLNENNDVNTIMKNADETLTDKSLKSSHLSFSRTIKYEILNELSLRLKEFNNMTKHQINQIFAKRIECTEAYKHFILWNGNIHILICSRSKTKIWLSDSLVNVKFNSENKTNQSGGKDNAKTEKNKCRAHREKYEHIQKTCMIGPYVGDLIQQLESVLYIIGLLQSTDFSSTHIIHQIFGNFNNLSKIQQQYTETKINKNVEWNINSNLSRKLNKYQYMAIANVIQYNKLCQIQGPPGTGKSTMIASLLHNYTYHNIQKTDRKTCIITAVTRKAVCAIVDKILSYNQNYEYERTQMLYSGEKSTHFDYNSNDTKNQHIKWLLVNSASYDRDMSNGDSAEDSENNIFTRHFNQAHKYSKFVLEGVVNEQTKMKKLMKKNLYLSNILSLLNIGIDSLSDVVKKVSIDSSKVIHKFKKVCRKIILKKRLQKAILAQKLRKALYELIDQQKKEMERERLFQTNFVLQDTCVIAGTIASIYREANDEKSVLYEKLNTADSVIVDEASTAGIRHLMLLMKLPIRRMVLVGDDNQLPVFSLSKENSSMNRLSNIPSFMLKIQYRMPLCLGQIVSKWFYNNELKTFIPYMETKKKQACYSLKPNNQSNPLTTNLVYGNAQIKNTSLMNLNEATTIVEHVIKLMISIHYHKKLRKDIMRENTKQNKTRVTLSVREIAIMSPYNAQVELIEQLLSTKIDSLKTKFDFSECCNVYVLTIDSSQGQEFEHVFISFVVSDQRRLTFLSDSRRMNVALSRAKQTCSIFINPRILQHNSMRILKEFKDQSKKYTILNQKTHQSDSHHFYENNDQISDILSQEYTEQKIDTKPQILKDTIMKSTADITNIGLSFNKSSIENIDDHNQNTFDLLESDVEPCNKTPQSTYENNLSVEMQQCIKTKSRGRNQIENTVDEISNVSTHIANSSPLFHQDITIQHAEDIQESKAWPALTTKGEPCKWCLKKGSGFFCGRWPNH